MKKSFCDICEAPAVRPDWDIIRDVTVKGEALNIQIKVRPKAVETPLDICNSCAHLAVKIAMNEFAPPKESKP